MSRCFPYPPPGIEKSLALIESIKLQKERETARKERKKEKKREKKKEVKSWGDKEKTEAKKDSHRKRHYEELSQSTHKTGDFTKTGEDESEQLEKSSLTEEGGPAAVQSLYDSSDSTHNSSKRSKLQSAEVSRTGHGNGLRIRLPLSRHKDAESHISSERPCFSGRTETVPAQQEPKAAVHHHAPSSTEQPCFSGRTGTTPAEELHETAGGEPLSPEAGRVHGSSCIGSYDRDMRLLYKKLILEWNPPPLQVENPEVDDQDWLFEETSRRRHHGQGETRGGEQAAGEDPGLGSALCSWPPRAFFLPEVGIHALPYVVPF